ncbi:GNAT family N-acetyltransferase [Chryseolinea sp. T2]|uniref:GNAT family N-acetyltransferase n=1 Tax=Chryseolinea sp. T2 TaxID=3129255 RepID=UPI003077E20F
MQVPIDPEPHLIQAEPVLPVTNVAETITYWRETLAFPNHWIWGDPPGHGGVSWNGSAGIQFTLNPELAARSVGNSVWIHVRNINQLYDQHQNKANIVAPLKAQPWGMVEYTVKDFNGYFVTFSGKYEGHEPSGYRLPASVVVGHKKPGLANVRNLLKSVGWSDEETVPSLQEQIDTAITIVCAESDNQLIGIAFLLGDGLHFYYVKDVDVHPAWQRKGIGTAMMNELMQWLRRNARPSATVGLFTGDHLGPFYRQFGFMQAVGMYKTVGQLT